MLRYPVARIHLRAKANPSFLRKAFMSATPHHRRAGGQTTLMATVVAEFCSAFGSLGKLRIVDILPALLNLAEGQGAPHDLEDVHRYMAEFQNGSPPGLLHWGSTLESPSVRDGGTQLYHTVDFVPHVHDRFGRLSLGGPPGAWSFCADYSARPTSGGAAQGLFDFFRSELGYDVCAATEFEANVHGTDLSVQLELAQISG